MKQTAVQWLIEELQRLPLEKRMEKSHLFFHALKMEKEQLNNAIIEGINLANKGYGKKNRS